MSYVDKIDNYQGDCNILLGKHKLFSSYVKDFANGQQKDSHGLDLGTGPGGCNSQFFANNGIKIDGCDAEIEVVKSLKNNYFLKFLFVLGKDILPYSSASLDFIVCSCVIQHLNNINELLHGINEISRVLKSGGSLYLMFKVGTNDTYFTHFNSYYNQERTFKVFSLGAVSKLCESMSLYLASSEYLLDDNYIPYCCAIFSRL